MYKKNAMIIYGSMRWATWELLLTYSKEQMSSSALSFTSLGICTFLPLILAYSPDSLCIIMVVHLGIIECCWFAIQNKH